MMVTASMRDQRVPFWQPAKFVARLRQHIEDQDQVWLLLPDSVPFSLIPRVPSSCLPGLSLSSPWWSHG